MYIDPIILNWTLMLGASFCAFMVGRLLYQQTEDEVIEKTVLYLIQNNFIRAQKNENDEWEILDLDGEK